MFFVVSEKARNKAIAHAMSQPSAGRDAQGLLVIKEVPKAIEVVKPSPWLPKLDSAKFQKLDMWTARSFARQSRSSIP